MYELNYGSDGKVISISKLNTDGSVSSFYLDEANSDFQDFLIWNAEQKVPLDLNSTIPVVVPEKPRDLAVEVTTLDGRVGALEEEKETLKLQVEALEVLSVGVVEEKPIE